MHMQEHGQGSMFSMYTKQSLATSTRSRVWVHPDLVASHAHTPLFTVSPPALHTGPTCSPRL